MTKIATIFWNGFIRKYEVVVYTRGDVVNPFPLVDGRIIREYSIPKDNTMDFIKDLHAKCTRVNSGEQADNIFV